MGQGWRSYNVLAQGISALGAEFLNSKNIELWVYSVLFILKCFGENEHDGLCEESPGEHEERDGAGTWSGK